MDKGKFITNCGMCGFVVITMITGDISPVVCNNCEDKKVPHAPETQHAYRVNETSSGAIATTILGTVTARVLTLSATLNITK